MSSKVTGLLDVSLHETHVFVRPYKLTFVFVLTAAILPLFFQP